MGTLMESSGILHGDNTIPGVKIPDEVMVEIPKILQACRDFGLDFFPTIVEFLDYSEISEIASYGGFPVRYPHWSWGMEYEEMSKGYENGLHRIYEMVINANPCYIYCLNSNTFVDHVTVIAHATGHNDFFKNNIYFNPTNQNMVNKMANDGSRIRRYMAEWGNSEVQKFIDKVLSLSTLIDPANAWSKREYKEPVLWQKRKHQDPRRLNVKAGHEHMEDWINTPDWIHAEKERIKREELMKKVGLLASPDRDIFAYMRDNAPLTNWQQDIIAMLYEESIYFNPQGQTKTINEGWASYVDSQMMSRYGMATEQGIVEYALHKAGVLGGMYSTNPYKLGYLLLLWIEERWNKGRFGYNWDNCTDVRERELWDKKLGQGLEKVFEVRHLYDDVNLISEFLDQDFCDKYKFFLYKEHADGSREILSRDANLIRDNLVKSRVNRGLPDVRLVEPNFRNKGIFTMRHYWNGSQILYPSYAQETLTAISSIWDGPAMVLTKDPDGNEFCYYCHEAGAKAVKTTPDKV